MNEKQREVFKNLPKLQQAVALEKMGDPLITDYQAYVNAKGGDVGNRPASANIVSKMMKSPDLIWLIESFKTTLDDTRINEKIMTREQLLEDLTIIANATIFDICQLLHVDDEMINSESGEMYTGVESFTIKRLGDIAPEHHKLVREIKQGRYGLEVKLIDPMQARKMLAEMQGFNAPVKTEITVTKSMDDFYKQFDDE